MVVSVIWRFLTFRLRWLHKENNEANAAQLPVDFEAGNWT